jgi:hypothetical protein
MKRYPLVDLGAIQRELGDELEAAVLEIVRDQNFAPASPASKAPSRNGWAPVRRSAWATAPTRWSWPFARSA